jgi:hypothetical protein
MSIERGLGFCLAGLLTAASLASAGVSPVADAAMNGDRTAIRTLVQQKANVNAPQVDRHDRAALGGSSRRSGDRRAIDSRGREGFRREQRGRDALVPRQC